jgi:asparagine synthase (glutamine-hydrolysing)
MCGIAGIWNFRAEETYDRLISRIDRMNDALRHRGPDAEGRWIDAPAGIALGHRRLAIVELSAAGAQPMHSASGHYVIVFNGEIYNYREIRRDLGSARALEFRGHSDTEVLLAAIEKWGVRAAIERTNGMFAFALWDRKQRLLTLARDRLGEKPLYYSLNQRECVFGSELKSILAQQNVRGGLNPQALVDYLHSGYIASPHTIWEGVRKLPPGCLMEIPLDPITPPMPECYWDLRQVAAKGIGARRVRSVEEIDTEFTYLFEDSVRLRNHADVPIGSFLSGGIDSTATVTALAVASPTPIRTYTVGFTGGLFDERAEARKVAHYLGTRHQDFVIEGNRFFELLPQLPTIYDEPFADPSQIPSTLVCAAARQHVTVCFSGDGGDELFGGYTRYQTHPKLWNIVRLLRLIMGGKAPAILQQMARIVPSGFDGAVQSSLKRFAPGFDSAAAALGRIGKLSAARGSVELYRLMMAWCLHPQALLSPEVTRPATDKYAALAALAEGADFLLLADQMLYLPENNLTKMDRAGMNSALEVRIPLLDHRLVEFSWQLANHEKFRHGSGKLPLRRYLASRLPPEVLARPKRGFSVPIALWLRTDLKDWAYSLLFGSDVPGREYFQGPALEKLWAEHQAGRLDHANELWSALTYLNWARATIPATANAS